MKIKMNGRRANPNIGPDIPEADGESLFADVLKNLCKVQAEIRDTETLVNTHLVVKNQLRGDCITTDGCDCRSCLKDAIRRFERVSRSNKAGLDNDKISVSESQNLEAVDALNDCFHGILAISPGPAAELTELLADACRDRG